jgi:hypothetical protein
VSSARGPAVSACLCLTLLTPSLLAGQGVNTLAAACAAATPTEAGSCADAALAGRALAGQMGLLAGLGSEVAGSASTLGRRLGTTPRVAVSLRGGGLQARLPDLTDRGSNPPHELSVFVPTLHGSIALGLFDGFRLMPTVGGFLSLDVVGQTSLSYFPQDQGFEGRVGALSFGARIGILRESFTLPGISVSIAHRLLGEGRFGDATSGDPADVSVDPSVTSYRATVGKDLFAVGVMLGAGWDSYSGDFTVRVRDEGGGIATSAASLDSGRALFFGAASLNFLVLQISGELGWARGFSSSAASLGRAFDPTRGSVFGSLSARLTI